MNVAGGGTCAQPRERVCGVPAAGAAVRHARAPTVVPAAQGQPLHGCSCHQVCACPLPKHASACRCSKVLGTRLSFVQWAEVCAWAQDTRDDLAAQAGLHPCSPVLWWQLGQLILQHAPDQHPAIGEALPESLADPVPLDICLCMQNSMGLACRIHATVTQKMQLNKSIASPMQAVLSMCEGNLMVPRLLGDAVTLAAALAQSAWLCVGLRSPLHQAGCIALLFSQVRTWRKYHPLCMQDCLHGG